jgi:circadian clock protein KaiB
VLEIVLELYIVGHSSGSLTAVANLRRICDERVARRYDLEVHTVDILENPEAAEAANIVATPTLIRRSPLPIRRIVGDLSETDVVLAALGIDEEAAE